MYPSCGTISTKASCLTSMPLRTIATLATSPTTTSTVRATLSYPSFSVINRCEPAVRLLKTKRPDASDVCCTDVSTCATVTPARGWASSSVTVPSMDPVSADTVGGGAAVDDVAGTSLPPPPLQP